MCTRLRPELLCCLPSGWVLEKSIRKRGLGHAHSGYWRNFVLTSAAAELRNKFSMENPGPATLLRSCSPRSGRGPQVVCVTESEEEAEGGLSIICQLTVVALSNCVVVEFAVAICLAVLWLPLFFLPTFPFALLCFVIRTVCQGLDY